MFRRAAAGVFSAAKQIIQRFLPVGNDVDAIGKPRLLERVQSQFHVVGVVFHQQNVNEFLAVAVGFGGAGFSIRKLMHKQRRDGHAERVRQPGDAFQRKIARAAFHVGNVSAMQIRPLRQFLLRKPLLLSPSFDRSPERYFGVKFLHGGGFFKSLFWCR